MNVTKRSPGGYTVNIVNADTGQRTSVNVDTIEQAFDQAQLAILGVAETLDMMKGSRQLDRLLR